MVSPKQQMFNDVNFGYLTTPEAGTGIVALTPPVIEATQIGDDRAVVYLRPVLGATRYEGGFGDIAWVIALGPLNRVLSQVDEKGLVPLLKDCSFMTWSHKERHPHSILPFVAMPPFCVYAERMYHAEQAWREVLVKSGFDSFVTGWFAGLAKGRLVKFENGTVGVDRWHCYRQIAWTELQPWLQAHGLAKTYVPIALTLS
ncbi:hypothetical protein T492DRAFT_836099 [Pavlovales sp. CCMP2436]|nr:hypothetical protein T492DRAFT_836099 [Pavlovales sp. CCMP2436]